jgi:uncharacterized SAM-binding protein YcdF (DUF218 family)
MEIDEITEYIFLNDENPTGDIAFVFGTWNAWKESVVKAADLYKKGFIPKIIVSGGLNPTTGIIEGDMMAEELKKLGVLKNDILVENKSTNTLENVLFSMQVIDKTLGLQNIHTITAVVKNYHACRALMTLRRHISKGIKLKASAYTAAHYPFTKDNWNNTEKGSEKVNEELEKIKNYLAKGDLEEL